MPLWKVFHSPGAFEKPASRRELSKSITNYYTTHTGMPAFYVGVVFLAIPENGIYIGGEPRSESNPFVRVEVDQIHIRLPDEDAQYKRNLDGLCEMLGPHLEGVNWEIHVDQTDRRLWAIDGIAPPLWKSEEEGRWKEAGRALERL